MQFDKDLPTTFTCVHALALALTVTHTNSCRHHREREREVGRDFGSNPPRGGHSHEMHNLFLSKKVGCPHSKLQTSKHGKRPFEGTMFSYFISIIS